MAGLCIVIRTINTKYILISTEVHIEIESSQIQQHHTPVGSISSIKTHHTVDDIINTLRVDVNERSEGSKAVGE